MVSVAGDNSTAPSGRFEPLIVTCAITGDQRQANNPNLPVTLAEQVAAAKEAYAAGAAIVHIHGRDPDDPAKPSRDPEHYAAINAAIREAVPGVLIDNTQLVKPLGGVPLLTGSLHAYTAEIASAAPDIMALNPGPMTFRGGSGSASSVIATSFDDTVRMAAAMRARGVKPQVFIYHPGSLDLLGELIARDVLARPYFVQLVFGQQGGIAASLDAFLFTVRQLPAETVYQTCALGRAAIDLNLLALLHGGHARTGMEDTLDFLPGEPATGNAQLVNRVVECARALGRPVATVEQTRRILGLDGTSQG
jgi:3-keto-5-aminohexanoate cleavage enzyme